MTIQISTSQKTPLLRKGKGSSVQWFVRWLFPSKPARSLKEIRDAARETLPYWKEMATLEREENDRLKAEKSKIKQLLADMVKTQEAYGLGASLNHPRVTRSLSAARDFLNLSS